jgi:hypothetical protein
VIIDTARLGTAKAAPGGGVVVPARIGRSGVQLYRRPDGSPVRAYRPPDEVRVADYAGAPVTVGHPDGGVSPATWRQHAVGVVRAQDSATERRGAHDFVRAALQISDADAIGRLGTELVECSCAYTASKDWTAGVTPEGDAYDVIFRGLVPNHVALGPVGFARAGREARLIADGETDMDRLSNDTLIADDGAAPLPGAPAPPPAATGTTDRDRLVADAAILREENARLTKELETERGARAAAETKAAEAAKTLDGLPKAIADGVTAELAFRQAIAPRLPKDYAFEGKAPRQVKIDAIRHGNPKAEIADDVSDAWLDGFLANGSPVVEHDHNSTHGPAAPVADGANESIYRKRSREAFAGKGS